MIDIEDFIPQTPFYQGSSPGSNRSEVKVDKKIKRVMESDTMTDIQKQEKVEKLKQGKSFRRQKKNGFHMYQEHDTEVDRHQQLMDSGQEKDVYNEFFNKLIKIPSHLVFQAIGDCALMLVFLNIEGSIENKQLPNKKMMDELFDAMDQTTSINPLINQLRDIITEFRITIKLIS